MILGILGITGYGDDLYKTLLFPKEDILKMLDAAVHAPSPKHQQNWHFVVVQNKDTIEKMADDVKYRVW
ncbi:MAG: nitroreductase family protein [Clostridium sp.]